ncbi:MAG: ethanolamine utilization protein EutH [Clostridia bacterium]|nr:ethanolamine utilization protein EutH [Clostridia bacterium]
MEYALSVTMAIFALIGALDRITGNHLKLGDEFEKAYIQ